LINTFPEKHRVGRKHLNRSFIARRFYWERQLKATLHKSKDRINHVALDREYASLKKTFKEIPSEILGLITNPGLYWNKLTVTLTVMICVAGATFRGHYI
jgi:hypothetical protein